MTISIEDFKKTELKVGRILEVEEIEGLDKLYKLTVDLREEKPRTILAGVKEFLKKEELQGKNIVVVSNLEPKEVRGVLSEGMLLAAEDPEGRPTIISPTGEVPPGTPIR
ncbi:MAG: tRNA-binding protein [bacterium]|nr:tRNA-binding protein [bacterium]